jgi:biotin operon repressor
MITDYITDRAITRAELCAKTGLTDREVRAQIAQARRDGAAIVSLSKGYRLTDSNDELYALYKREKARALTILTNQKQIRLRLKAAGYKV